jgi:ATP phosphoribosyltransferase
LKKFREEILMFASPLTTVLPLTLGLPTGRLQPTVIALFERAKIDVNPPQSRAYQVILDHELIKMVRWIHPRELPQALREGFIDAAIMGSDCYDEWSLSVKDKSSYVAWYSGIQWPEKSLNKPFNVSLIAALDETATAPRAEEIICTDFPFIAQRTFPQAKIAPLRGSVESFVPDRYRFGITIVETGNTLKANGLREVRPLWYNWLRFYFRKHDQTAGTAVKSLIESVNR